MRTTQDISILTIVHQRRHALLNMLDGIARGGLHPQEVVVIHMNEMPYELLPWYPFLIRSIPFFTGDGLNLAAARNAALQESSSFHNIFLDVDCIPEKNLLESYHRHFQLQDGLFSGRVRYLPKGFDQTADWNDRMQELSDPDPIREEIDQYPYELFWSLNFGCSKEIFHRIGSFDTSYEGYGAEDTDFAFQAKDNGVPIHTIDATAFHQYHSSCNPPLNHLKTIVDNARRFHGKWKKWPMEGWLRGFEKRGFIRWRTETTLELLRLPTEEEIASCVRT